MQLGWEPARRLYSGGCTGHSDHIMHRNNIFHGRAKAGAPNVHPQVDMAQLLRPQEGRHLYVALQLCQRPRLHGPADMASHLQLRFALQHASGPVPCRRTQPACDIC